MRGRYYDRNRTFASDEYVVVEYVASNGQDVTFLGQVIDIPDGDIYIERLNYSDPKRVIITDEGELVNASTRTGFGELEGVYRMSRNYDY